MDYASTATGSEGGKPLLLMPDQDHPDTMNQIVWSLMDILESQSIDGVAFDKENEASYNRVRIAIQQMINAAKASKATLPEVRTGENDAKFVTPLGATAASGNYSQYISVATTPAVIAETAMGGLIIASGSAAAINLPALSGVARVGAAYHFLNLSSNAVSISRVGGDQILKENGTATVVVLRSGNSVSLIKISETQWAVVGYKQNAAPFQKEYVSAWQNYQSKPGTGFVASLLPALTHGLGELPKLMSMDWECLVAEGYYSVGHVVEMPAGQSSSQSNSGSSFDAGFSVTKTITQIEIAFDTNHGMMLHERNQESNFRPANNSWRFRLKAWA